MAKKKLIEFEAKQRLAEPVTEHERGNQGPSSEIRPVDASEARRAARQVIFRSAGDMVKELIAASSGSYLAVKFLFEFAGLMSDDTEADSAPSPLLRYYLEGIRNTPPVSSEANNEVKSESV